MKLNKGIFGTRREKTCTWQHNKKPVCSATQTSYNIEIVDEANLTTLLSMNNKGPDQTVRMHRLVCAFVDH